VKRSYISSIEKARWFSDVGGDGCVRGGGRLVVLAPGPGPSPSASLVLTNHLASPTRAADVDGLLGRRTRIGLVPADRVVAEALARNGPAIAKASTIS
jgi:hypothetical protein